MENNLLELSKDGKKISSVLPPHVKNFLIDIDGTICEDIPNEEPERMLMRLFILVHLKKLINGMTMGTS